MPNGYVNLRLKNKLDKLSDKQQINHRYIRGISDLLIQTPVCDLASYDEAQLIHYFQLLLRSNDEAIIANRRVAIIELKKLNFFDKYYSIMDAFSYALKHADKFALHDLLSHKNIIPNSELLKFSVYYTDKLVAYDRYDLFHRLNPSEYSKKKWSSLNSYQKLYFLVYEYDLIKMVSHRLGVAGKIHLRWHNLMLKNIGVNTEKYEDPIDLEGNWDGCSLLNFKESILMFLVHYFGKHADTLEGAVNEVIDLKPYKAHRFRHKLRDQKHHPYIFALKDNHTVCGYHTKDGYYYQINMGYLCGNEPGIKIFKVPECFKASLHSDLCGLQYSGNTTRFYEIPKKNHLRKVGYIRLPEQKVGNCTYESLRGLFAAILFHHFKENMTVTKAAKATLTMIRHFLNFDADDALRLYMRQSLSQNVDLIDKAITAKDKFHKQVGNNLLFGYQSYTRKGKLNEGLNHEYKSSKHKRVVRVDCSTI